MHDHGHDFLEGLSRPKAARIEEELPGHTTRAAAAGRPDVLSGSDLLGLQRAVGNAGVSSLMEEDASLVHGVVSSGGRPLDEPVRTDMETRLGHDFSDVRVHDDAAAHDSASAVNAHAYTVGSHLVFQRDAYDPTSASGRQTLAHELTHVVQQRSGPVDGTAAPGGIKVSDPTDRFEREASETAARVLSSPTTGMTEGAPVQRQEAEEEEELQRTAVQRDEALEEETQDSPGWPER